MFQVIHTKSASLYILPFVHYKMFIVVRAFLLYCVKWESGAYICVNVKRHQSVILHYVLINKDKLLYFWNLGHRTDIRCEQGKAALSWKVQYIRYRLQWYKLPMIKMYTANWNWLLFFNWHLTAFNSLILIFILLNILSDSSRFCIVWHFSCSKSE